MKNYSMILEQVDCAADLNSPWTLELIVKSSFIQLKYDEQTYSAEWQKPLEG